MKIEQLDRTNMYALKDQLKERLASSFEAEEHVVKEIISSVRSLGDEALFAYTKQFDGIKLSPDTCLVTDDEIKAAYQEVDEELIRVIRRAIDRIRSFHEKQISEGFLLEDETGTMLGQRVIPMDIAGVYAPGGKASYPSSVIMNVIPAKVAGVRTIVLATPADRNGHIPAITLVAACESGVDRIYKIGGAQAIAAMAYGTETIPKVDKITGPGNVYVALAKKAVFGDVSIDSVAGPSEVVVLCDDTADPSYVAADLLSQAEHDERACSILITTSKRMASEVRDEIERMIPQLSRRDIIKTSISDYGRIYVTNTIEEAVEAANAIAPEHLEIITQDAEAIASRIVHAGAIFVGPYSSEPLGDYMAGPNHILPTSGTARFFSALGVSDFVKKTSMIRFSEEGFLSLCDDVITFANAEGLTAHANSIAVRLRKEEERK